MSSRAQPFFTNRQRGIVLPSVLWITILTIVVAVNYASDVQLNTRTADNMKTSTLARYDAISGIYLALDRLLLERASADVDYQVELNGNTVGIGIRPENTKTSLNDANIDELRETFGRAGVEAAMAMTLAARVIDWRDHDHSTRAYGMEDAGYYASGKPYGARDARIEDLVELLLMADIDPQLFKTLAQHVTIYSPRSPRLYSVTARVRDSQGKQSYVTQATVQITGQPRKPYRILKWQHHNG